MAGGFFLMCLLVATATVTVQHSTKEVNSTLMPDQTLKKTILEKLLKIEGALAVSHQCPHREGLAAVVTQLAVDLQNTKSQLQTTQTELQTTRTELQTTRTELQTTRTELQTTRTELQTTRTELQTTRTELQTTRTELQTTRTELQTTRTELQTTRTELQTTRTELQTTRTELQTTRTELQTTRTELQTTRTELQTTRTELQTTRTELQTTRTELQTTRTELQTTRTELQTTRTELQTTRTELQTTRTELQTTRTELQTTRTELQTTRTELQTTRTELQTTRTELQTTRTELQTTRTELQTTRTELQTTRTELQTTKTELGALKDMKSEQGSTFVRWGRKSCPPKTTLVYSGTAGGKFYTSTGSGGNKLCLTPSPQFDNTPVPRLYGTLYGGEYEAIPGHHQHNVPCSVCRTAEATTIMIAGTLTCPAGWTSQYTGHLASERDHSKHQASEYVCVDGNLEDSHAGDRNDNGNLFHYVKTVCGALPCPPYADGKVVTCAVCSK